MQVTSQLDSQENSRSKRSNTSTFDEACLVKIYPAIVAGSLIPVVSEISVFGRDASCDFELADNFASRQHAFLQWIDGEWQITDLGSTNGTFVNDVQITRQQLLNGDQIRIGKHIFKFLATDHVEKAYHEAVFNMMTVDALTRTYNRRYFDEVIQREVVRSMRHERSLGVLIFDIDHFKVINDSYGHLVGDELLTKVCDRITERISSDDVFARIGGEEFAVAVVETSPEGLDNLGRDLCQLVARESFETSGGSISLTISCGGAHTTGVPSLTTMQLMAVADANLYRAKRNGRNCYCSQECSFKS